VLWQEKSDESDFIVPDSVQDLSFRINCHELPVDHAWLLYTAIVKHLPWLEHDPIAGIHSIHVAASGNGWTRPADVSGSMLQLSKRTRLYLRLPKSRISDAIALTNKNLMLGRFPLQIGSSQAKSLVATDTVFCRSLSGFDDDEETFTEQVADALATQGIRATKMLCGLSHIVHSPSGDVNARSVLLADMTLEESLFLQQYGLGSGKLLGCGIFLPHKSLAAVGSSQDTN